MDDFIKYLGNRVYIKPDKYFYDKGILQETFRLTLIDVKYHFNDISDNELINRIINNQNELAIFLYRMGNIIYNIDSSSKSLNAIHFLMKDICSCEIYYSTQIDEGFYLVHGVGTVIGSRNKIGKGFKIYQNCTIGHRNNSAKGNIIGDNVICYAGAKILGENVIGDNIIIGANTLIIKDIPSNVIVYGNPLIIKKSGDSIL